MILSRVLGSQRVPFSMRSLDFHESRCEPVLTLPSTIDELVGGQLPAVREPTMHGSDKRSEPSVNSEVPVLLDVVDPDVIERARHRAIRARNIG